MRPISTPLATGALGHGARLPNRRAPAQDRHVELQVLTQQILVIALGQWIKLACEEVAEALLNHALFFWRPRSVLVVKRHHVTDLVVTASAPATNEFDDLSQDDLEMLLASKLKK